MTASLSYAPDCIDLGRMRERDWYLPKQLDRQWFGGLKIIREEVYVEPFALKPLAPAGRTVLASYVGDENGFLEEGMEEAAGAAVG